MIKLSVMYEMGTSVAASTVEVADDEEYWFEPPGSTLCVGPKGAPMGPGYEARVHTQHGGLAQMTPPPRPRLHIFNLCRVEVLP